MSSKRISDEDLPEVETRLDVLQAQHDRIESKLDLVLNLLRRQSGLPEVRTDPDLIEPARRRDG
jgi:hypothetical protein